MPVGGRAWPDNTQRQAAPVWRAPEGPEGTGGLRGAATNEVRPPTLAGGRPIRRPQHQRGNKQQVSEPGCGTRGRRGLATSRRAERSSRRGRRAGGQAARRPEICRGNKQQAERPPPTSTPSSPAQRPGPTAHATPATPHTTPAQPPGYAKGAGTEVPAPCRLTQPLPRRGLRPDDRQSLRRRRIHRNMPPTTAAPRPAPPIRPSKPVRARPRFGLVAGTSGAT